MIDRELGIFSWYGFYESFDTRLSNIKTAGFDGVMLWWEDEYGDYPVNRFDMPHIVSDMGLKIHNIHLAGESPNDIWSDSLSKRSKEVDRLKAMIYELASLELDPMVLHICEGYDLPLPPKELLYSMEAIAHYAEDLDVVLALENTWDVRYLDIIFNEVPSPAIQLCYDTSHGQLGGHLGFLHKWRKLLCTTHFSDNDGIDDRHWLPYDGMIDYDKILPNYAGTYFPVTLEVIADKTRYDNPAEFLVTAYERCAKLGKGLMNLG